MQRLNAQQQSPDLFKKYSQFGQAVKERTQLRDLDADANEISSRLARWYDQHASIRRLWAIEDGSVLTVCVSLEPTSDGADALPVWLAMNREWTSALQSLCGRDVQLQFVEPDVLPPSYLAGDAITVVDVDWRQSWIYA